MDVGGDVDVSGDGDVLARQLFASAADTSIVMLSCQKLDVYRCAIAFLALAFEISAQVTRGNAPLPDQLKRAATSIPLNIAEAAGRSGNADAARTYAIARGSAMPVRGDSRRRKYAQDRRAGSASSWHGARRADRCDADSVVPLKPNRSEHVAVAVAVYVAAHVHGILDVSNRSVL